jgi:subtilisin family serine protease
MRAKGSRRATSFANRWLPATVLAAVAFAALAAFTAPAAARSGRAPSAFVVVLEPGSDVAALVHEARVRDGIPVQSVYRHAIRGFAAELTEAQRRRLASDPRVAFLEPDRTVELAGATPSGVDRVEADLAPTAGIDGRGGTVDADVALIDTGIQPDHPDLNVVGGHDCVPGAPDSWADGNGHGTHVAGIVGALDDGDSTVGVAPGVRLWAVRAFQSDGFSRLSWIVCAIDWVTGLREPGGRPRIEVVNMSLRDPGSDDGACGSRNGDAEHASICRSVAAGTTYVVAAGNDRTPASRWIPAAYDEVITVSALADFDGVGGALASATCTVLGSGERDDTFADFSNYGADVDLIAPGKCIRSTSLGGGMRISSGTSMAAPHVSGAAALYLAAHPGSSPVAVLAALRAAGSPDWIVGSDPDAGHEPLLNVHAIGGVADLSRPLVTAPTARIASGLAVTAGGSVPIRLAWSGSDAGTGIAHYDLWRSTDGAPYGRVRLGGPRITQLVAWLTAGHTYRHRTDAWDHGGNRSPVMDGREDRLSMYQSLHSSVAYRGSWRTQSTSSALGSGTTYSLVAGSTATFSFSGRDVAWISSEGSDRGRARVRLDGQEIAVVDLERSTFRPRAIVLERPTDSGAHTLRITVLEGRVDVDAFLVVR